MKNSRQVLRGSGKMLFGALKGLGSTGLNLVKITADVGTAVVLGTAAATCIVVETVAEGASKVVDSVVEKRVARQTERAQVQVEALYELIKQLDALSNKTVSVEQEEKLETNFSIDNG